MEASLFRRIGTVYFVLCFSAMAFASIAYFRRVTARYEEACVESCEHGMVDLVLLASCTTVCVLSTFFLVFVLVGIRDKAPGHITFNKIFMLVRNCVLAVRWIYEIIEVTIYHIHGDGQGNTGDTVITNSVLLVVVLVVSQWCVNLVQFVFMDAVITPVEMYVLSGIERDTRQRLRERESKKESCANGDASVCVEMMPLDGKS
ncbi:hypothetical protein RP20_CCG014183 [Aedes albopictus]|nr:hypothetical protein RP20_CCG014183 [Aedes albopictus]